MSDTRILGPGNIDEVVDVLCESFHDYPVMRFVLEGSKDYVHELDRLIHFFVTARVLRREWLIGSGEAGSMSGVAIVSRPDGESPPALRDARDVLWQQLGDAARGRYEAFGAACATFGIDAPHIYLNMIGVRRAASGEGVGRRLIDHVHGMSAEDERSTGVSLTTEDEANVALYRHLGYEIVGEADVTPALHTWGFFRHDTGAGG